MAPRRADLSYPARVREAPASVQELGRRLAALGWVTDLLVAGSLATGDYVPGVSDLDLVALVDGPIGTARLVELKTLHEDLDEGLAAGEALGCVYVDGARLMEPAAKHPTWTHGTMVQRTLSGVTRAELARHGFAVFGRPPLHVLSAMNDDDVRQAARAELLGYWTWASRRPWVWLDPVIADLGLTSMARARHTLATGELLTKTRAVHQADAPAWLLDQLRDRRSGRDVPSPRLRVGLIAWRDTRRTIALVRG